ncbi:MAG: hypothetical protein OXG39_09945 [Chloroflexi bacterium]|nr:hypothetical protein [Chloroflexota bacterium]
MTIETYPTSVRLPVDWRQRIAAAAAAESRRPSEWIREAIRAALAAAEREARRQPLATAAP